MKTLHERVAEKMAASTVGRYHSYEVILQSLRAKYPTESDLRAVIGTMEAAARIAFGDPNIRFLDET